MTLEESVEYHTKQLVDETVDETDAEHYIENVVSDILEEHPNESEIEIEKLVREKLKVLYED